MKHRLVASLDSDSLALGSPALVREEGTPSKRCLRGLDWLNFFVADIQTGIGPFVAIYLAASHWNPEQVGIALTIGGLAGVVAQAPGGALVDAARQKRLLLTIGIVLLVTAALLLALTRPFPSS